MPLVRFTCPRCRTLLKFNHPSPQGKRVRCARCRTISSVRLAQPRAAGRRPDTKLILLPPLILDDPPSMTRMAPPPVKVAARAATRPPPRTPAPPALPIRPKPPPVYEPDEALDDFDESDAPDTAAPPRKKGLDATPLLVGLVAGVYLSAVAAAYFGAFDGDAFTGGLSANPGQRVGPKDIPGPRDDTVRDSPP
jgi:LSD1 subclass zinc finger protein